MAASMEWSRFLFWSLLFPTVLLISSHEDDFHEELFIKPLPSGHLYNHFQFTTTWGVDLRDKDAFLHYHIFPKSLGEVLAQFSVQELHLSLTQGLWRYDKWGYPVIDTPPGAELWVWFQEDTRNVDSTWTDLINVLSGMFCASLNFLDSKSTINPKFSFRPQGVAHKWYSHDRSNQLLRYAALPGENVCTENLTPWKKLLPCGAKAGLATLLNAVKLYDASYHSLRIHFRPVCQNENCSRTAVELSQTLSVVFEPMMLPGAKQDWTFKKLYGRQLSSSCPLASTSRAYVDATSNKTLVYYFTLSPEPSEMTTVIRGVEKLKYAVYDIPQFVSFGRVLNLGAKYNMQMEYKSVVPPLLHAHRFQTGYGQDQGGITCILSNTHPTEDITVVYMETVPWFLRSYFHTLQIENFKSMAIGENATALKPMQTHYIPGKDRLRPYHLEVVLTLPASSITKVSWQFERALLKWTEYPPDANHGFYVSSAVVSAVIPSSAHYTATPQSSARIAAVLEDDSKSFFLRLHTETLLVTLPTPDFSMPYNVICLACTVVAIAFGSIHNLTTRRFVLLDPTKKRGLIAKIKGLVSKLIKRKSPDQNETVANDGQIEESKKEK